MSFTPTVFTFKMDSFEKVPSGEYISRKAVSAIYSTTYEMVEAIKKWKIQIIKVDCLDRLREKLNKEGILYSAQD